MFAAASPKSAKTSGQEIPGRSRVKVETAERVPANPLWHGLATRVQSKLTVGAADDPYEWEADRVAAQVMRMPAAVVQRKCDACAAGSAPCPSCEEEPRIQRKSGGAADAGAVRGDFASRLGGGVPLDSASREFFEPRFGRDFGDVRVHMGAQADSAARSISARAFTLGRNVAFAAGEYAPRSERGRSLLAHELTHVVQQSRPEGRAGDRAVQRACLPDSECKKTQEGSAVQAIEDVSEEEAPKRAERRKQAPKKVRSGAHGGLATQADRLFRENLKELYSLVHGVFVDEDAARSVGASIEGCKAWAENSLPGKTELPQFEGAKHRCVFVSKALEEEADKFYNSSDQTIGGRSRDDWRIDILGRFTHEATHERFLEKTLRHKVPELKFPTPPPGDETCKLEFSGDAPIGLAREISELAAEIGEFPVHRHASDPKSTQSLGAWFKDKLTNKGESIPGTIREIRCSCACDAADAFIRGAFDVASLTWPEEQKTAFHVQMKRGFGADYNVYWPFDLPAREGTVGRHELSLDLGVGFTGSSKLPVAMLTYRYVLSQWAAGRLRLTAGAQLNPGALLASSFDLPTHGEFGAETLGLQFISTPHSVESKFGGFTARIDTGLGIGEFLLRPATPGGPEATGVRSDYILQVGAGIQFFIPGLTSMRPVSLEGAFRLAQPLDLDAKRIQTFGLTLSLPLGG